MNEDQPIGTEKVLVDGDDSIPTYTVRALLGTKSNSNGSCQKWGAKCHFATLNSVLAPLNSVFAPMIGAKIGCHSNN